jgi:hypothetical protein
MVDFILEHYIITIGFLLLICVLIYVFNIHPTITKEKNKLKEVEKTDFGTKLEEKIKEADLVEIKEFDDDEYVREVFNSVFYSIQCDDWSKDISYDKIKFSKKKQTDRYNSKSVTIEFDYRFDSDKDYKKRIFTIKDVKLIDGSYTSFYFKGSLPIEVKKFLYDVYSEWINERNSKEKEKVDKSLENIKDILGKASERGAKLDELLGN